MEVWSGWIGTGPQMDWQDVDTAAAREATSCPQWAFFENMASGASCISVWRRRPRFYNCFPKASGSSEGKLSFPVYSISEGSMSVATLSAPAISQLCGAACLESLLKTPFFFHVYVCVYVCTCNMHVYVFAYVRVGRCV